MHRMIQRHTHRSDAGGKSEGDEEQPGEAKKYHLAGRSEGSSLFKMLLLPILVVFIVGGTAVYNVAYVKVSPRQRL